MEPFPASIHTLEFTYAYSAYSCVAFVFPLHLAFAYCMDIIGILCFVTRVWPRYKKFHYLFGRLYLLSLLWCVGTSLLIHNHGLNVIILVAMIAMIVSVSVGYMAITMHKYVKKDKTTAFSRFFSLKSLHGICMAFAWWTSVGRTITHKPGQWVRCYTQPAFKELVNNTIVFLPDEDPDSFFTWTFPIYTLLPPLFVFIVIGIAYSIWEARTISYIKISDDI